MLGSLLKTVFFFVVFFIEQKFTTGCYIMVNEVRSRGLFPGIPNLDEYIQRFWVSMVRITSPLKVDLVWTSSHVHDCISHPAPL